MGKILIFGGFGFVSRNIVSTLCEKHDFVLVDRQIDREFALKYSVKCYERDLLKESAKSILEEEKPDFIINTISIVNAVRDIDMIPQMMEVNLGILINIYKSSSELSSLKALVHLGSAEEYGPIDVPFKEDMRELPVSPYALCKQITTNTAIMLHRNYNYPAIVVRPSNLFGDGQPTDKFVPYIISQIKENKPLRLTSCEQKRDFVSTTYFAQTLGLIIENYQKAIGQIINIGSGQSIKLIDIVEYTKKYFDSSSEIAFGAIPLRENEMMDFVSDIQKLNDITNNENKFDFWSEYNTYLQ